MRAKNSHYIILILITFLSTNACRSKEPLAAASGAGGVSTLTAKEVKLGQAESRKLTRTVSAPGTLAADEQATLSFKVAGRMSDLRVDLGTLVSQGQTIARLETTEFQVRLEQAKAALQQARVRLGLPPEGDDDRVDTEKTALVRQARAVLEEAQLNRDQIGRASC